MVYTPEVLTVNSTISRSTSTPVNKPSGRKPLCQFNKILDVEHKNDVRRLCDDRSNIKDIRITHML